MKNYLVYHGAITIARFPSELQGRACECPDCMNQYKLGYATRSQEPVFDLSSTTKIHYCSTPKGSNLDIYLFLLSTIVTTLNFSHALVKTDKTSRVSIEPKHSDLIHQKSSSLRSEHTFIKCQIEAASTNERTVCARGPFVGNPRTNLPDGLPFRLTDYLELVDWTGRIIRDDKRGAIDGSTPAILERLDIDTEHWLYLTLHYDSSFKSLVGTLHSLKRACVQMGMQRMPGRTACETWF